MPINIRELKRKRFEFLNLLYEKTGGDRLMGINYREIAEELSFEDNETVQIVEYLNGEGLTKWQAMGGIVAITHGGVVEIEQALSEPSKPTDHFLPINVIHVENMIGSQIQQGSLNSTQSGQFGATQSEQVSELINLLRTQLPKLGLTAEKEQEINADIDSVEAQIKSPKPKVNIIREGLSSIRAIIESIVGNIATGALLQMLGNIRF